jgi:hypothetical protein
MPCFLGEPTQPFPPDQDRLEELAAWTTSPDNPFFARAQVNRIWFHLMGRGIVDPIDDFRATNPPAIPALLDELAREFVAHRFDLRHVVRLVMNSSTYQLSAVANDTNRDDEINFSHASTRRLSAEELLDAMSQVTGVSPRFSGFPNGLRAAQLPGVQAMRFRHHAASRDDQFLVLFGKPPRLLTCECERSTEATLSQAFQLVSGPAINDLLTQPDNRLGKLLAEPGKPREAMLDELYLAALSRFPTDVERTAALQYFNRAAEPRAAIEDITWSLLNAKAFLLRH